MEIVRRIGPGPQELGCSKDNNCPGIFELATGEFALVGMHVTASEAVVGLPADGGVGEDERMIVVPRALLIGAAAQLAGEP